MTFIPGDQSKGWLPVDIYRASAGEDEPDPLSVKCPLCKVEPGKPCLLRAEHSPANFSGMADYSFGPHPARVEAARIKAAEDE